jgi:RNA polymerase sporulation-specific sigma factor
MGVKFSTYAVPVILGEMRTLTRISAPCHIPRQDRELRARVRRAEALLRQQNHREPTVTELAMALRMDPAELTLAMEEIATVPLDAPLGGSTHPVAELIPDPQGESWLNKLLLQDMLERLPQRERKLLYLRWRQGLTQAETARALGMTQVQVSRAEMRLKSQLRRQWMDSG